MMTRVIATHPPVELVGQRDDHTRVWEIVKEVETTHPDGSTTVDAVKSYIHEKGSGLCYKDAGGSYVPSIAEWRETPEGFVVGRCAYGLAIGKKIGAGMGYNVEGHELALRPAYLKVSDGVNEAHLALLNPDVEGFVVDGKPSVVRFPAAFGPGYDLEYVAEKGGFHQNLIVAAPPQLPAGLDPGSTAIHLYTEMNLDEYLAASGLDARVNGEKIDTRGGGLASMVSTYGSVSFTEPVEDPEELPHLINAFTLSRVFDSPAPEEARKGTCAAKRLLRDGETNATYLLESVPVSYFSGHRAATYPVIWDFESVSGPISGGTWIPKNTYYVTGTVYVQGTLTIKPGTTVKFAQSKKLHVVSPNGYIYAKGEPYNYITLTSWRDDSSGEDLTPGQHTYGAPGDYSSAILIENGTPSCSHIAYCKIGYADTALEVYARVAPPISHNIIRDYSNVGILHSGPGVWLNTIHNNLLAISQYHTGAPTGVVLSSCLSCTVSNNTITGLGGLYHYRGVLVTDTPSGYHDIRDNLITYALYGVVGNNDYYSRKNAFFSTPGGALINPANPSDPERKIDLYAAPYALSQSSDLAGECFINFSGEGGKLRDTGSRQADADPPLDGDEFSQVPPNEVEGGEHSDPEQWSPITTSEPYPSKDTGVVDVGYHHNRIDRYLLDTAYFNGQEASLDVTPGTVVAFGGDPRSSGIELRFENEAKLRCDGDPAHGGYNLFTRRDSVSMFVESPWYLNQYCAELKLKDEVDDESTITFCRFRGSASLTLDGSSIDRPIKSNIFSHTFWAVMATNGAQADVCNNLFHWNYGAFAAWPEASLAFSGEIFNNTMDESDYGAYLYLSLGDRCRLHDNLITSNVCGIYAGGSGEVIEQYNAFFDNDSNYLLNGTPEPVAGSDLLLQESPYRSQQSGYAANWILGETSRVVDGGSVSSCDAGLRIYSTHLYYYLDEGQVDIGYHWKPFDESVIFVDGVNGDDDTGDGSCTKPYLTIHKGVAETGPGKPTVYVLPATYLYQWGTQTETLDLDKSSINVYGSGARLCSIASAGAPNETLSRPLVQVVNQSHVEFEGFTIRGRENEMEEDWTGNGGGIHCSNVFDLRIAYCTIRDNRADYGAGIYMKDSEVVVDHWYAPGQPIFRVTGM